MKTLSVAAAATLLAATQVSAHMRMTNPPPLRSKDNPNNGGDINYSDTTPLSTDGSNFPCQGALSVLGTDKAKPVEQYVAGQSYSVTIDGGAFHGGGSCQISLSFDQGQTFKVVKSFVGNCPTSNGPSQLPFTMPADTPDGEALLAWTWFNQIGNREMYMQCASVITSGGGGSVASFSSSRPDIFTANIGNGCKTTEGTDVVFPNPGSDVVQDSAKAAPPTGSCAAAAPAAPAAPANEGDSSNNSGGDGNGNGNGAGASQPEPTQAAGQDPAYGDKTLPGGVFVTVPADATEAQPTTLTTVTKTSAGAAPTEEAPEPETSADESPAESPATEPAEVAPQPESPASGSGSDSVQGAQSGACSNEGAWNCVGGTQFQRCASGQWSVLMDMASGTTCTPGISEDLYGSSKKKLRLRFMRN